MQTVKTGHGSQNDSVLFSFGRILIVKRTVIMRSLLFTGSDRTVRSRFKNHALKKRVFHEKQILVVRATRKLPLLHKASHLFFFEKPPQRRGDETNSLRKISKIHRFSLQGSSSIQTWNGENLQADLAKQCATLLACLRE